MSKPSSVAKSAKTSSPELPDRTDEVIYLFGTDSSLPTARVVATRFPVRAIAVDILATPLHLLIGGHGQ